MEAKEFAEYLLTEAKSRDLELDGMQIHKLTYICHGFFLAKGLNLITETPRTWLYGPIYPSIASWLTDNDAVLKSPPRCKAETVNEIEGSESKKIIDSVLKHFGDWTGTQLSLWTHRPDSPWERAMVSTGRLDTPIDKNDMKSYFKPMIQ